MIAILAFNESIKFQDYVHDVMTLNLHVASSVFIKTGFLLHFLVGLVSNDGVSALSISGRFV